MLSLPSPEELKCVCCCGALILRNCWYVCLACNTTYQVVDDIPVLLSRSSLERAKLEDERWHNHPVEGRDNPVQNILNHKKKYIHFFQNTILKKFSFYGKVLEIGAGSCWASSYVKLFNPECHVYSTDISVQALLRGQETSRFLKANIDHMVTCDVYHLPFENEMFDIVFGVAILHHLTSLKDAVKEVWRVLKPRGLYVGVREGMAASSIKPLYKLLGRGYEEEKWFRAIENVYTYKEWIHFFSEFDVEVVLKRNANLGLTLIEKTYYTLANIFPESLLKHVTATLEITARKLDD